MKANLRAGLPEIDEYPDNAGYPDGRGSLHEGTDPLREQEFDVIAEFIDTDSRDE